MKKVIVGFGLLLVLIVGGLLVAPSFIDWSAQRAEISKLVKDATGRDLFIGGDIEFSILPSPVLKVGDVHFSNASNARSADMVSVRQLDVQVFLMPLLAGNVHIQSVRLIEPEIHLEIFENGQGNWVFNSDEPVQPQQTKQPGEPTFVDAQTDTNHDLPLQIDDFFIDGGTIHVFDHKSQDTYQLDKIHTRFAIAGLQGPFEASGKAVFQDIAFGFDGSVGQLVNGRTLTFSTQLTLPYGPTKARLNGTLVNLNEDPKLKGSLDITGDSLAAVVAGFSKNNKQPASFDRPFSASGEINATASSAEFGPNGLQVTFGEERAIMQMAYEKSSKTNVHVSMDFATIDLGKWPLGETKTIALVTDLPNVFEPAKIDQTSSKSKTSSILKAPEETARTVQKAQSKKQGLPKDISVSFDLDVDALVYKTEAVRQLQAKVLMENGELVLERFSGLLPSAGDFSVLGAGDMETGAFQFDGSFDVNINQARRTLERLDIDVSALAKDKLQNIAIKSRFDVNAKEFKLLDLFAKVDETTLKGASTFVLGDRLSFGALASVDQLDLDGFLATPSKAKAVTQKESEPTSTKAPSSQPSPSKDVVNPLEALDMLSQFDANLDVSVGALTYQGQAIKDIAFRGRVFNSDVVVEKFSIKNLAGSQVGLKGALLKDGGSYKADKLSVTLQSKNLSKLMTLAKLDKLAKWQALGATDLGLDINGPLLAPDVNMTASALDSNLFATGQFDILPLPKGEASINLQLQNMSKWLDAFKVDYRPQSNPGQIELNSDVAFNLTDIHLNNLAGRIGKSDFTGAIKYHMAGRPKLDVMIESQGVLDLTAFKPFEKTASSQKASKPISSSSSSSQSSTASSSAQDRWSRDVIDMSALNNMDAKVDMKAKSLVYDIYRAQDFSLSAVLENAIFELKNLSGKTYGGNLVASGRLDGSVTPSSLTSKASISDLNLGDVASVFQLKELGGGRLNASSTLSTKGQSVYDFVNALNGQVQGNASGLKLSQQAQKKSPLAVLNFLTLLSGRDASKSVADVTFGADVKNGVATLSSTKLDSAIALGTATGTVNLPLWQADIAGSFNLQQTALNSLLMDKANIKQSYPFAVKGDLSSPNIKLDTGGISSGGGLVIPLSDKLEKKGVGSLLRGVLGAKGVSVQAPETQAPANENNAPASDGTIAPPPPPPSGSSSSTQAPSLEQKLLQGLGTLLQKR